MNVKRIGLLAQHEALTARELSAELKLPDVETLHAWLGRLGDFGLVQTSGKTKSMRCFVAAEVVRHLELPTSTTLQRIKPHRLKALVLEDLRHHPGSSISQVNERIGTEINQNRLKRTIDQLIGQNQVRAEGERRGRKYWLA